MREVRRYYTYLRNEFQAKNQKLIKDGDDGESSDLKRRYCGDCCDCGAPIQKEFNLSLIEGIFEQTQICNKCFTRNFFDFTKLKEYQEHFNKLRNRIRVANKIVIIGRGKIAEDTLFYDCLDLDASKIVCVIDERTENEELIGIEEHSNSKNKFFYNLPRLRKEEIKNINFDLALVADLLPQMLSAIYPFKFDERIEYINPITAELSKTINQNNINSSEKKYNFSFISMKLYLKKLLSKNAHIKSIAKSIRDLYIKYRIF